MPDPQAFPIPTSLATPRDRKATVEALPKTEVACWVRSREVGKGYAAAVAPGPPNGRILPASRRPP